MSSASGIVVSTKESGAGFPPWFPTSKPYAAVSAVACSCSLSWGELERAPHRRVGLGFCHSRYIYIYIGIGGPTAIFEPAPFLQPCTFFWPDLVDRKLHTEPRITRIPTEPRLLRAYQCKPAYLRTAKSTWRPVGSGFFSVSDSIDFNFKKILNSPERERCRKVHIDACTHSDAQCMRAEVRPGYLQQSTWHAVRSGFLTLSTCPGPWVWHDGLRASTSVQACFCQGSMYVYMYMGYWSSSVRLRRAKPQDAHALCQLPLLRLIDIGFNEQRQWSNELAETRSSSPHNALHSPSCICCCYHALCIAASASPCARSPSTTTGKARMSRISGPESLQQLAVIWRKVWLTVSESSILTVNTFHSRTRWTRANGGQHAIPQYAWHNRLKSLSWPIAKYT